jgi:hypothetical protein
MGNPNDLFIEKLEGLGIDGKIYPFIKDNDNVPRWSIEKKDVAISSIRYSVNLGKMEKALSSPGDASIIRKNFARPAKLFSFWLDRG